MVDAPFIERVDAALATLQEHLPQAGSLRQIPMDMVAAAVAREMLGLSPAVRVIAVKAGTDPRRLAGCVEAVARRWAGVPVSTRRDHAFESSTQE